MTKTAMGTVLVLVGIAFALSGITLWFTIGWWVGLPQFFLALCQLVVAAGTFTGDDGDSQQYRSRAPYIGCRHDHWAASGTPHW